MTKIVNLTPHPLTLRRPDGTELEIAPSPQGPARVSATPGSHAGEIEGVPVYGAPTWGEVSGLPAPEDDTVYIVSSLVAAHISGRGDVYVPGTGPKDGAVRNEQGHIVAVTRLIKAC